jgi:hypothetical protein
MSDGALEVESDVISLFWTEDGLIEGTADGLSEGTIDGKSDGMSTCSSVAATVLVVRVDPLFLLSLGLFEEMITAHRNAIVIAMIAIDFFVVQAILPSCT